MNFTRISQMIRPGNGDHPPAAPLIFYRASDFFKRADEASSAIRIQLAESLSSGMGPLPLTYVFRRNSYQFLTGSIESILSPPLLSDLVGALGSWANDVLSITHVSTPRARVYVRGSWRGLLRDDVRAPWHYMLCLTPKELKSAARIEILAEEVSGSVFSISRNRILRAAFNELIVHSVAAPYGIEPVSASFNPLEADIFLDGYLW
jgi:hypothetical protein